VSWSPPWFGTCKFFQAEIVNSTPNPNPGGRGTTRPLAPTVSPVWHWWRYQELMLPPAQLSVSLQWANYFAMRLCRPHGEYIHKTKLNSVAWVRERTVTTGRPQIVGEVSTNFCEKRVHVVSVTDPYGHILGFLDRSRIFTYKTKLRDLSSRANYTIRETAACRRS
jgi:hypothetical protein